MSKFELFGTMRCPYTVEMREWLEWHSYDYIEYNVQQDAAALSRMKELTGGQLTVPVLARDGKLVQIGWHGRGCAVAS